MATPWREIKHKFSEAVHLEIKREAEAEAERLGFKDAPWSDFFPDGTPVLGDAYSPSLTPLPLRKRE